MGSEDTAAGAEKMLLPPLGGAALPKILPPPPDEAAPPKMLLTPPDEAALPEMLPLPPDEAAPKLLMAPPVEAAPNMLPPQPDEAALKMLLVPSVAAARKRLLGPAVDTAPKRLPLPPNEPPPDEAASKMLLPPDEAELPKMLLPPKVNPLSTLVFSVLPFAVPTSKMDLMEAPPLLPPLVVAPKRPAGPLKTRPTPPPASAVAAFALSAASTLALANMLLAPDDPAPNKLPLPALADPNIENMPESSLPPSLAPRALPAFAFVALSSPCLFPSPPATAAGATTEAPKSVFAPPLKPKIEEDDEAAGAVEEPLEALLPNGNAPVEALLDDAPKIDARPLPLPHEAPPELLSPKREAPELLAALLAKMDVRLPEDVPLPKIDVAPQVEPDDEPPKPKSDEPEEADEAAEAKRAVASVLPTNKLIVPLLPAGGVPKMLLESIAPRILAAPLAGVLKMLPPLVPPNNVLAAPLLPLLLLPLLALVPLPLVAFVLPKMLVVEDAFPKMLPLLPVPAGSPKMLAPDASPAVLPPAGAEPSKSARPPLPAPTLVLAPKIFIGAAAVVPLEPLPKRGVAAGAPAPPLPAPSASSSSFTSLSSSSHAFGSA
mmetsp:Transcript_9988/g.26898  ORF Transcript_9988/g.26898 Transcript_9988/m.26898 type:complete len:603 (-) Transcript_9988:931-2739(-)